MYTVLERCHVIRCSFRRILNSSNWLTDWKPARTTVTGRVLRRYHQYAGGEQNGEEFSAAHPVPQEPSSDWYFASNTANGSKPASSTTPDFAYTNRRARLVWPPPSLHLPCNYSYGGVTTTIRVLFDCDSTALRSFYVTAYPFWAVALRSK